MYIHMSLFLLYINILTILGQDIKIDNINGPYQVKEGYHYANKTSITWGKNGEKDWSINIKFDNNAAIYNSSTTCDDEAWYGDWNKLWGKARCGYYHDHHKDSDRFVWRRCSESTCGIYDNSGSSYIQIGGYSYDNGNAPYNEPGSSMGLLQPFSTLIKPNIYYKLNMIMDDTGITYYNEGTVNGLYFGGDCKAPIDIVVDYSS